MLPPTGIAHFLKDNVNVRSAPSIRADSVAKYKLNEHVKYDSIFENEGRVWISYIGRSGNRRYVCGIADDGDHFVAVERGSFPTTNEINELKSQLLQMNNDLSDQKRIKEEAENDVKNLKAQISRLSVLINALNNELNEKLVNIDTYKTIITQKDIEINLLNTQLKNEREKNSQNKKDIDKSIEIQDENKSALLQHFHIDPKQIENSPSANQAKVFLAKDIESELIEKVKIGRGATSDIFKITKKGVDFSLALKEMFFQEIEKNDLSHFFGEYEMLNSLNNPFVLRAYGYCFGDETHSPSILLEYCPYNLYEVIKDKEQKFNLSSGDKVKIILQIVYGMKCVHDNQIIHRDLKPENILITNDPSIKSPNSLFTLCAKICDFGISTLEGIRTKTGGVGTFLYMAPEVANMLNEYTKSVDIFSFGSILYFILTNGETPNSKNSYYNKKSHIPNVVNEFSKKLIQRCWSFGPKERPDFDEIITLLVENHYMLFDDINNVEIETFVEEIKKQII